MSRPFRIIVSISLLFASFIIMVFFVWPAYKEFSELRAQVADRRDRLEFGQSVLAQLRRVQGEVSAHKEDFEKLGRAIPEDSSLPVLYGHIQAVAASSGLVLNSIDGHRASGGSEENATVLIFQVNLVGSYEGLKSFLNASIISGRILNIQTLAVSRDSQNPGELGISVELAAYAMPS
jgi:Tfp pilus assembly protein PilO